MTTILSQKGQIVLPRAVREMLHLQPGDDFEVTVEDDETISLRRMTRPTNHGLVDLLLACPSALDIPLRERDDSPALEL